MMDELEPYALRAERLKVLYLRQGEVLSQELSRWLRGRALVCKRHSETLQILCTGTSVRDGKIKVHGVPQSRDKLWGRMHRTFELEDVQRVSEDLYKDELPI